MRSYELIVLLHPDLEIDVDTPVAAIEKLITDAGGKIVKRDNWGKKRLAYAIRKQDFAVYIYFKLQLPTSAVAELERNLGITEEVIRHLLVSFVAGKPEAKPNEVKKTAAAVEEN